MSESTESIETFNQFEVLLKWEGNDPLYPGRQYQFRAVPGVPELGFCVTRIKHIEGVDGKADFARSIQCGQTARVNLALSTKVASQDLQTDNGQLSLNGTTLGLISLTVNFPLYRARNLSWTRAEVDREARQELMLQRACCVWFTGLSGSGKSAIADMVEQELHEDGHYTFILDGDNVRHGLNRDLGFTEGDRVENIRRVAEVARLMVDAGLIVMVSLISPYKADRAMARSLFEPGTFFEVFVDTSIQECENRDPKGLYKKARSGELKNFTGVDSPYEKPDAPDLHLETEGMELDDLVSEVLEFLEQSGVLE